MIRFTLTTEWLVDLFTQSGQAIVMTDGGLDGQQNKLVSIEYDNIKHHVVMLFTDGSDVITDRTITFTAPMIGGHVQNRTV